MLLAAIFSFAFASTALGQSEIGACLKKYNETFTKMATFYGAMAEAKEECMATPDCAPKVEPLGECFKDMEGMKQMKKMLEEQKWEKLSGAMKEIGAALAADPKCQQGGQADYKSLREVPGLEGGKHVHHLFKGKHCKMAMMHDILQKDVCKCVGECMMKKLMENPALKDGMSLDAFNQKIEWLAGDPMTSPMPEVVKELDIKHAGLCVVNACGFERVMSIIVGNGKMRDFQDHMKSVKALMTGASIQEKMKKICTCLRKVPGANADFDCENFPKDLGMTKGKASPNIQKCIGLKKKMMEDFRDYYTNVGGTK